MTLQLEGRKLCFWCVEAHHGCHVHNTCDVFWNDVSIGAFSDSDGFQIVDERNLINLDNSVRLTFGKFSIPPTSSTTQLPANSPIFKFKKCENPKIVQKIEKLPKKPQPKTKTVKNANKLEIKEEENGEKRSYYTKIHRNAIKTVPAVVYTKGKKCDLSQKLFVCDICEMSFTLRHNLQNHLCTFHGDTANMTEKIVAKLKKTRPNPKKRVKEEAGY